MSPPSNETSPWRLALPENVLRDIGRCLADSNSQRSLAALASTSRYFYDLLIPELYRELNLTRKPKRKPTRRPKRKKVEAKQIYSIGPFALLAPPLEKFYSPSQDAEGVVIAPSFKRQTRLLRALAHTVRLTLYDTQLFRHAPRVERLAIAHLEMTGKRLMPALTSIVVCPPCEYDEQLPLAPASELHATDDGTLAEAMLIACSPLYICIRAPIAVGTMAYQPFFDADGNLLLKTRWAKRSRQFRHWLTEWGKRNLPAMLTWHRVPLITMPVDQSHPMRQTRVEEAIEWDYRGPRLIDSGYELTPAEEDWRISARSKLLRVERRVALRVVNRWLRPEWTFFKSTAQVVFPRVLVVNPGGHVNPTSLSRPRPVDDCRKGIPWTEAHDRFRGNWKRANNNVTHGNGAIKDWEDVKHVLFFGTAEGEIACDGCRNA